MAVSCIELPRTLLEHRGLCSLALLLLLWTMPTCRRDPPSRPAQIPDAPAAQQAPATRGEQAGKAEPAAPWQVFSTAGEALQEILKTRPLVLGLGEVHQRTDSARVRSAISRFTDELLGLLSPLASDLVVETWITEGGCGEQEQKVVRDVERTTKRPEVTESEVVRLLRRARELGVRPHILRLGCKDYKALLEDGKVDYDRLLRLIARHLRDRAAAALGRPAQGRAGSEATAAGQAPATRTGHQARRLVVLYGGALHNDLYPYQELKAYSYAAALQQLSRGRYVELDLYVPEYVEGDETLSKESWYPTFQRLASAERVLLIQRGKGSYILVLRRGVPPDRPPGKRPSVPVSGAR